MSLRLFGQPFLLHSNIHSEIVASSAWSKTGFGPCFNDDSELLILQRIVGFGPLNVRHFLAANVHKHFSLRHPAFLHLITDSLCLIIEAIWLN